MPVRVQTAPSIPTQIAEAVLLSDDIVLEIIENALVPDQEQSPTTPSCGTDIRLAMAGCLPPSMGESLRSLAPGLELGKAISSPTPPPSTPMVLSPRRDLRGGCGAQDRGGTDGPPEQPPVVIVEPYFVSPEDMPQPWTSLGAEPSTFLCPICLCAEAITTATNMPLCGHQICSPCFQAYLTARIHDGDIQVKCPYLDADSQRCDVVLNGDDLAAIIADEELLRKLERFRAARERPNARPCPQCEALQLGDPATPQITCGVCGAVFCLMHGDAHPPMESCEEFEERTRGQDAVTQEHILQTSKPCPKCRVFTHKYTGCNHMTCPRCQEDWCWLCGESIDATGTFPLHYDSRNAESSCAGKQFTTEDEPDSRCLRGCRLAFYFCPLAFPFYLLGLAIYALIIVAMSPCLLRSHTLRRRWCSRRRVASAATLGWAVPCVAVAVLMLLLAGVLGWLLGLLVLVLCCPFYAVASPRDAWQASSSLLLWPIEALQATWEIMTTP